MKNSFEDAEELGRNEFKKTYHNWQWIAWGDTIMLYDAIMGTKDELEYIVEIKKRDFGFGKYPDYILEKSKADSMLEAYNNNKDKLNGALYVNILDDKVLAWDITKLNLSATTTNYCPKHTVDDNKQFTNKICYHLNPNDTIWIIDI